MLLGMRNALHLYQKMDKETTYAIETRVISPSLGQKCNKLADRNRQHAKNQSISMASKEKALSVKSDHLPPIISEL